MTSPDRFSERARLEDALRRHYRGRVDGVEFRPITADEVRSAAAGGARPRRPGWLLAAAAGVAVAMIGSVVLAGQLASRPVSAVPAPTPTAVTATPGTGTLAPSWTPRVTAVVDADRYAQAEVGEAVYLFAGIADDKTCGLDAYRYLGGPDLWQRLAGGPARDGSGCARTDAFAAGSRVYVAIGTEGDQPHLELYSYDTDADRWGELPGPGLADGVGCTPLGLEDGIFCLDEAAAPSSGPVTFHWFDYSSATWVPGEALVASGQDRLSVAAHAVTIADRDLVLLDVRLPGGGIALATYDPGNGRVGHEAGSPGTGASLGPAQPAGDGTVYFTPPSDPVREGLEPGDPRAVTALVVDLAAGQWRTLEVPHPDGPLTRTSPSDAAWALRFYSAETAGDVLANGYLYRPGQRRWLAVPGLPVPEAASSGPYAWVGSSLLCRTGEPLNCWGVAAAPLEQLATVLDPAEITASNAQVR